MPHVYINGTEVDTIAGNYGVNFQSSDFGKASQPLPNIKATKAGNFYLAPGKEHWLQREGKLVAKIRGAVSYWDKLRLKSEFDKLLYSQRPGQLVYGPKQLNNVYFEASQIIDDGLKNSGHGLRIEVPWVAADPMWQLNQPLDNIDWSAVPALYWDSGIYYDDEQPPYLFGRDLAGDQEITASPSGSNPHFTIDNWGTAFVYPTISITNGLSSGTTWYLKGSLSRRVQLSFTGGSASVSASDRFYLEVGDNDIRFEDVNGTAINLTAYSTLRVDFGDTKLRFL